MTTPCIADNAEKNHKTAKPKKIDIIGKLPPEVVEIILFYLTPEDLRSAVSCCLRWKAVISYNYFWKTLCLREAYLEVEESQRSEFYTNFFQRYNYWQAVYWYNYTLRQNWMKSRCKKRIHRIREPENILSCLFFEDLFVVKCMDQMKLFVYNLKSKKIKRTVLRLRHQETDGIFKNGYGKLLKSGKYLSHFIKRRTLTVWDYENEIEVLDVFWHDVTKVYAYQNLFALETLETYDNDILQVYNVESRHIEYVSRGIFDTLVIMDERVVFLTPDNYIHIVKWSDKSFVDIACCSKQRRKSPSFLVKSDLLLSFCHHKINSNIQTFLCAWNISTKTRLYSKSVENLYLEAAFFVNNYLFNSYLGQTFALVDYTNGNVIVRVTGVETYGLISNDQFIIVRRGNSRNLSLWCLKTKDFVCDLDFNLKGNYRSGINLAISKTRIAYAKKSHGDTVLLCVRDYEISDC